MNANSATKPGMMPIKNLAKNGPVGVLKRIYPWRRIRRSRAPSSGPGTFFAAQFSAGCTTNISGFDLRQAQVVNYASLERAFLMTSSAVGGFGGCQLRHNEVRTLNGRSE